MSGEASRILRLDAPLPDLWDKKHAATLGGPNLLLYRSNLLGSDLRITNFGGGNTSAKLDEKDPLTGEPVRVLWVKGSGGDIGSMKLDGFSTLYLDKLLSLRSVYRGLAREDEMVALFNHCTFNLNPRATSIDTPLHGFVPHAHVDHVHADAVIAIAASENAETLTRKIFGGELGFLPWQRPGFDLGLKLGAMAESEPELKGVVLGGHGLFTWGPTSKECYETTLAMINKASAWLAANARGKAFGGAVAEALPPAERRAVAAALMPAIRKRISAGERKIGHFSDAPEVLEFVNARDLKPLAALGTSCPDHFLRTKICPLVLPFDPAARNLDAVVGALDQSLASYRADYAAYYERRKRPNSPAMRDPNAVIYLVPGVGMLSFARDKATARIASEFYVNAINVMRGASSVSRYVGLAQQEAFDIEYWLLEEAKLQRMPKPKSLAGRVALVTGGAGGIGQAIAQRLMADGACVVLADIDRASLDRAVADFGKLFGKDAVAGVVGDVTDETATEAAFRDAVIGYGGVDIVVANAGIASAARVRGHLARTLESQHRDPRHRLFPVRQGRLPDHEGSGPRRQHRLHRVEERACRLARRFGLLHGQSRRSPSRAVPRARRRALRHPRQHRQSRRGAARIKNMAGRVARPARGLEQGRRVGARRSVPPAFAPQALRLSRGHCRGGLLFRVRSLGQEHRQHFERRRRQCRELHEVEL